jgi:hypothetical protein
MPVQNALTHQRLILPFITSSGTRAHCLETPGWSLPPARKVWNADRSSCPTTSQASRRSLRNEGERTRISQRCKKPSAWQRSLLPVQEGHIWGAFPSLGRTAVYLTRARREATVITSKMRCVLVRRARVEPRLTRIGRLTTSR